MINTIVFSPSGTTAQIARLLSDFLDSNSVTYDITVRDNERINLKTDTDTIIFAVPVYAGRIPALAAERLSAVHGNGQKAVAIAVYGNRDYDDALTELCDIINARGFKVVGAGAFIAQHCIFPKVAAGRPDTEDVIKIAEFADAVKHNIIAEKVIDINSIKGNRPYKKASGVPLHPDVDKNKCNSCGTCAEQCPTEAIDKTDLTHTDNSKCITCCRCINICPQNARYLGGMIYKLAGYKFVKDNTRRLDPEWFV